MPNDPLKTILETVNLTVGYTHQSKKNILFENLSLKLKRGEMVCFMGQNGIGKSTLIRTIAALQPPLDGVVKYYTGITDLKLLSQHLAVVLTDRITALNMTVYDIVSFGRYPYLDWHVRLRHEDEAYIHQTLAEVRISHLKNKRLYELSDGQLQMVMIARAVIQDTPIILLDEPTAHLDLNNRLEIMNLLRRLAHDHQKAILISTHELDLALQTADTVWLAGSNKDIICGMPEDLVLNGAFDLTFQFKGFDLRTGKVQHEQHRGLAIKLNGSGHIYLWTKNALERTGFTVTEGDAKHVIDVNEDGGILQWRLDNKTFFSSLELLLHHFEDKL